MFHETVLSWEETMFGYVCGYGDFWTMFFIQTDTYMVMIFYFHQMFALKG